MTAQQSQTMKVYLADFTKCETKSAFYHQIARAFGLRKSSVSGAERAFWRELCECAAGLTLCNVPVKVRISGLEQVYGFYPQGVEKLLRVLRAAESRSALFSADIKIGNAIWH